MPDRDRDIDELISIAARTVGALQSVANTQVARADTNERNRLSLLHLHGAAGMYVGPMFAAIGPPGMTGSTWVVLQSLPGMPYSMGALFFAAGLLLYEATTRRNIRLEVVGLLGMALCYATIALSFAAAVALWLAEWASVSEAFASAVLGAEAVSLMLWGLRRRRPRYSLMLHLCVGWSVGFSLGVHITPDTPRPWPSFYAHGVYAHLTAILVVHLITLAVRRRRGLG